MVKEHSPKTIVHFGAGEFIPGLYGPSVRRREYHVVYDPDKKIIREYVRRANALRPPNKPYNVYFLHVPFLHPKSAVKTNSHDNEVHTVHIHNVLSVQDQKTREALLKEAARIIHRRGRIFVSELYTARMHRPSELRKLADKFGLRIKVLVQHNGKKSREWNDIERKTLTKIMGSQGTVLHAANEAYLAELRKK